MNIITDRFSGKVMIITGAATGIGRETALRAAKEGAKLVLADRKDMEGQEVLGEIISGGGEGIFLNLELTEVKSAEIMVQAALAKYGSLNIAVNNAGVMGHPSPLHLIKDEDMRYTMENNFMSLFYCARAELKAMVAGDVGGVIINNASIAGLIGLPGNPAYVASKHAVNGLTRSMALDYAKYGIRVNSVNPAGTDTPMVEEALAYVKDSIKKAVEKGADPATAESMAGQKTQTLQKRNATPQEQAASILFLASDEASHITGTLFATDGGWTAY